MHEVKSLSALIHLFVVFVCGEFHNFEVIDVELQSRVNHFNIIIFDEDFATLLEFETSDIGLKLGCFYLWS